MQFDQLRRRDFITLLGGSAAWPLAARAQQPAMPVVGYLGSTTPEMSTKRLAAFRKGLRDAGFEEGQNVAIEFRWADGHEEWMPELVADLIRRGSCCAETHGGPHGQGARSGFWSVHRRLRGRPGPEPGASARQTGRGVAQLVLPDPDLSIDGRERRRA